MPKIVNYGARRQEIMKQAILVFAKYGYHNTNLGLISEKCGMGRTTLYQYFKNKDEIFYYTIESVLKDINTQIDKIAMNEECSFVEKLKKTIHQLTDEEYNFVFLLLLEIWLILKRKKNKILENLRGEIDKVKIKIEELIIKAIEAEEIISIDSKSLASTIYNFIETFTLNRTDCKFNKEARTESLNLLIDGLRT